jgi:hypothetical protein
MYTGLERLRARGVIQGIGLDTKPLTWNEIQRILSDTRTDDRSLDAYDRFLLSTLRHELDLEGRPLLQFSDSRGEVALVDVYPYAEGFLEKQKDEDDLRRNVTFETSIALRMRFGTFLGSYTRISYHQGYTGGGPGGHDVITWVLPGFELPVREAYVTFQLGSFNLELGRDKAQWGPGTQSLILNRTQEPLNLIKMSTPLGPAKLTVLWSLLDEEKNKFLAAQRLEIRPFDWLSLGFSESVVWSERLSLSYLNPVIPYYMMQRYYGRDRDNILGALDAALLIPSQGLEIYGQIMMDDARVGAEYDSFPDKVALMGGFLWADPLGLPNTDVRVEYTHIGTFTYTHKSHTNNYTLQDSFLLAHDLGTDGEGFYVTLRHFLPLPLIVSMHGEFTRKGEGRLDVPWEDDPVFFDDPFPSGIVEEKTSLWLQFDVNPLGRWEVLLDGRYTTFKNMGNVEGRDRDAFSASLSARYRI